MPFRQIPESNTRYALLSFDGECRERQDDPDGPMGDRILELASAGDVTNIFWFAHGWMGDVPAAVRQYDLWIRAFDTLAADRDRAASIFPKFRPLYIGLHWPSLPWGDEELRDGSFAAGDTMDPELLVSAYLQRMGDTPAVREAVNTIVEEARHGAARDTLSEDARRAFLTLDSELGLSGSPDADQIRFDPEAMYEQAGEASFGGPGGAVLSMLRAFSYWSMKKLARKIGEGPLHAFLKNLQSATAGAATPIHLMGHSFGCVLTASILRGPGEEPSLERAVDSVALVQGAISLWSHALSIPHLSIPGYFSRVVSGNKVRGPLITTRSHFDSAVSFPYQLASGVSGAISFEAGSYPLFGAMGRFGLQGLPENLCVDLPMRSAGESYDFECGKVYNLEASKFICKMSGSSGAHNDIGGAEVAHAIWAGAFASRHDR